VSEQIWPNFFIIGAPKAGTTSLYQYLKQHPDIFMSSVKEPHYFSRVPRSKNPLAYNQPVRNEQEYLNLFRNAANFPIRGEASPSYLWSPIAAENIYRQTPNAKLIAILRDPIARAYSHYLMDVRSNRQHLSFYDALLADIEKNLPVWDVANLYVDLGNYARQLENYLKVFPPDQVLVLLYEHLTNAPDEVMKKVLSFLEIAPADVSMLDLGKIHNRFLTPRKGLLWVQEKSILRNIYQKLLPLSLRAALRNRFMMRPGKKPAVDDKSRDLLQKIYTPEISALEKLLDRPLPEMRKSWQ
jgi:hypothetical protein